MPASQELLPEEGPFTCAECKSLVRTQQGLKAHTTRKHKKVTKGLTTLSAASTVGVIPGPSTSRSQLDENSLEEIVNTEATPTLGIPLAERLGAIKNSLKILRRVPKGARVSAAAALTETLTTCCMDSTPANWERLLSFAAVCLRVPEQPGTMKLSLTTLVKQNVAAYREGQPLPLVPDPTARNSWTGGRPPIRPRTRQDGPIHSDFTGAKAAQAKIAEGDIRGALRLLGSEDTFAPFDPHTLEALRRLHPPSTAEIGLHTPPATGTPPSPYQVSETDVKNALKTFPVGSAGGLDLLRPQHLRDLTSHSAGEAGTRLIAALTQISNLMLQGKVPEEICPTLYGASLCAFTKKDGGIRPIAVGSTLRRLVAKMCCHHIGPQLEELLSPTQMGVGTPNGLELATHLSRRFVTFQHKQRQVFLKIDFKNAFNTINRADVFQQVSALMPSLLPFLVQCYGSPTSLVFGGTAIPSANGVQQGDPLGPSLFCATLQPLVSRLKTDINIWYLDDGALGGSLEDVFRDYSWLVNHTPEVGLEINAAKCELFLIGFSPDEERAAESLFRTITPDIRACPVEKCAHLGTPLFTSAVEANLADKTRALQLVVTRLSHLPAQSAYYVLRHSQALPKLSYTLRCSPTWRFPAGLQAFDEVLRSALTSIINVDISGPAWEQASWPVSRGGLGISRASDVALAAFLASGMGTQARVGQLLPAAIANTPDSLLLEGVAEWQAMSHASLPSRDCYHIQKEWSAPLQDLSIRETGDAASSAIAKARLLGVSSPEAGAFLNALPSPAVGTFLEDDTFRIAVALRLGAAICEPHDCVCGAPVTPDGLHGLNCRRSAGRMSRHSEVNAVIHRALAAAGTPSTLEPIHLTLTSGVRPDGVSNIPWSRGKSVIWDFTCTNGLADSHVAMSAVERLYAAERAERNKIHKYAALTETYVFVPIAMECLGAMGRTGKSFLQEVGRRIEANSGDPRATEFLFQRLSAAVQRGNAVSIRGTLSHQANLDDSIASLQRL